MEGVPAFSILHCRSLVWGFGVLIGHRRDDLRCSGIRRKNPLAGYLTPGPPSRVETWLLVRHHADPALSRGPLPEAHAERQTSGADVQKGRICSSIESAGGRIPSPPPPAYPLLFLHPTTPTIRRKANPKILLLTTTCPVGRARHHPSGCLWFSNQTPNCLLKVTYSPPFLALLRGSVRALRGLHPPDLLGAPHLDRDVLALPLHGRGGGIGAHRG